MRAVVYQPCNFTVSLEAWQGEDSLEVFWLSNGVYVEPMDPLGARLVFTKTGPTNQTVRLQADLIGVFSLRFYVLGEQGERQWVTEEMELVVKRDNMEMNKMITILFTLLLSVALFFMGLELEVAVILATLKVLATLILATLKVGGTTSTVLIASLLQTQRPPITCHSSPITPHPETLGSPHRRLLSVRPDARLGLGAGLGLPTGILPDSTLHVFLQVFF